MKVENPETDWLGPNFYGGGGWGDALWGDTGIDRLVLVIPVDTEIVERRSDHDDNWDSLLSMVYDPYDPTIDDPTAGDPFARYPNAPVGAAGEKTITLSYRSVDHSVFTHDFYATAIEEIQLGLGSDAVVYSVNQATGALTERPDLAPLLDSDIPKRADFNHLFDTFGR